MDSIYDIILLTEQRYLAPKKTDWYTQQILNDAQVLTKALENRGLRVGRKSWDDPTFDWTSTQAVLFRTTWDYFDRFVEFKPWLHRIEKETRAFNPINQILWNIDKHYLLELEQKGIRIVDSYFIPKSSHITLEELHKKCKWEYTVLKPTVSGAARHTYRLSPSTRLEHEDIFQELIAQEDMILQVFQNNIITKGEVSMVMIDGQFSHAVLKKAKEGDYRVQDDFGGTVYDYTPDQAMIDFAQAAIQACATLPLYARVDIVWNNEEELALSELELIEPELWFRRSSNCADLLAEAIVKRL